MTLDLSTFSKLGYAVIDDFLPQDIAEKISGIYEKNTQWDKLEQVRENHYSHVFKTGIKHFPSANESYMASFDRSEILEQNHVIQKLFNDYFKAKIIELSGVKLTEFDVRCYRLEKGDFYRVHVDDYAGKINCIYYVNKKWIWDWGGILHVGSYENQDQVLPIFPKFNRAVLLDNAKFRSPHFISMVSKFAMEPRHTIVSFNK